MSEESVVLEDSPETQEESTSEDALDQFNPTEYEDYFPESGREEFSRILNERSFGWKRRARLLVAIKNETEYLARLRTELNNLGDTDPMSRGVKSVSPRTHLRLWLASRSDEVLQEMCQKHDVSYTSFMSSKDRVGLIECLIDQMMGE